MRMRQQDPAVSVGTFFVISAWPGRYRPGSWERKSFTPERTCSEPWGLRQRSPRLLMDPNQEGVAMSENHDSSHQGQNVDRLLEPHRALLARSTVSPEMMKQRGYWSAESRKELQELGFLPRQGNVPALITPIHCVEAQVGTHLMRPDKPRTNKEGVKAKYELPKGRPLRIDVPPACRAAVADPSKELWIADGPIQADAMASAGLTCIDVLGAHGWRHIKKPGKPVVLGDWQEIPFQGRTINTAFGSDVWASSERRADIQQFTLFLQNRGARVAMSSRKGAGAGKWCARKRGPP